MKAPVMQVSFLLVADYDKPVKVVTQSIDLGMLMRVPVKPTASAKHKIGQLIDSFIDRFLARFAKKMKAMIIGAQEVSYTITDMCVLVGERVTDSQQATQSIARV